VLKIIESKSDKLGQFIISLVGAGWAIATYFVVPILVVERVEPWDALKRSVSLMRRTWGESIVGNMGIGLVIMLFMLPGIAFIVLGIVGAAAWNQTALAVVGIVAGVIWMMVVSLISSATHTILLAALYRYAAEGTAPPQFDQQLLQQAFRSKR